MKTTIELPDELFREAKATAARRGTPLRQFFQEAVEDKLAREDGRRSHSAELHWPVPPLPLPAEENERINRAIEEAFEQIELEDEM